MKKSDSETGRLPLSILEKDRVYDIVNVQHWGSSLYTITIINLTLYVFPLFCSILNRCRSAWMTESCFAICQTDGQGGKKWISKITLGCITCLDETRGI